METQEKKFVPASKQIPTVNGGWLDRELGEAMSEAVRACLAHGKQSEITVKLKIQPQNIQSGTVKISHDVATKLPKEKREGGIVFATPDGNIQADDPAQGKLKLKQVPNTSSTLKMVRSN
ncbi:hypothetical protein [Neisseria meningitidis]|uniref:hypothetical protein n=1 Tax=Neisseria meningitidis TaxID=487 RepID=UPI0018CB5DD1|nr:hypothetical protein [Neisseria meningitidis]MBG9032354.1 hypothetical protein [Neisseria meningitidis]